MFSVSSHPERGGCPSPSQNTSTALADPRGSPGTRHPLGPNCFNFKQFLGKIGKNNRLVPPPVQLAHPPVGSPGSATALVQSSFRKDTLAVIGWGTPPSWRKWGTPLPPPPHQGEDGAPIPLPRTGYAWTDYGAGGMPLAVSRRRTFLFFKLDQEGVRVPGTPFGSANAPKLPQSVDLRPRIRMRVGSVYIGRKWMHLEITSELRNSKKVSLETKIRKSDRYHHFFLWT